ncbi:DnaJ domain-containing protein [Prevotellaceae bacterium LCP21S3_C11]
MAAGKWIGGFLGFMTGGPLGALAGFALGALFDKGLDSVNEDSGNQQAYAHSNRSYEGQRNSFMFSLLVLTSYIIKADGRVMHSEMELVRRFLSQNFGEQAKQQGEEILLKLFEQQKRLGMAEYRTVIQDSCHQIRANMAYEQCLQLLNFLVMIAQADAVVSPEEIAALKEVAIHMGLSVEDVIQMLNLRNGSSATSSLDDAYKVLGIAPSATNDEVKAAYRKMALKHHPDKVAALGEDVRKAAEKKFQEINDAKEKIFKARGL